MKVSDDVNKFLADLNAKLQGEANVKINKAMRLFIECDNQMKGAVLVASGFIGPLSADRLRDHFDTLELMDVLDDLIFDMQDDVNYNATNKAESEG